MDEEESMPRQYELAHEHVEWFLRVLQPLLVSHFVHGYKHGMEDTLNDNQSMQPSKNGG